MRTLIKKTIITTFLVGLITIGFYFLLPNKTVDEPIVQIQTSSFTNANFNTSLSVANTRETFVTFSSIHSIIETAMLTTYADNATRDQAMLNSITTLVGSHRISIGSALELYQFSTDVSYNWQNSASASNYPYYLTITKLLSLNYALVGDIDYTSMRAKKFIPIGMSFTLPEATPVDIYKPFLGSFDGNGFTISNLYIADYAYITMVYQFNGNENTSVDIPLAKYYSIFAHIGSTGLVKNLSVKNPTFELVDTPEGLNKASMFAGENKGLIYNVNVIDTKTNTLGEDISGIRYNIQYVTSGTTYTASGFVYDNASSGQIYNSFLVSKNVIATAYKYRFTVKPFVYNNNGLIDNVAFDSILLPNVDIQTQPSGVTAYTTTQLKSGLISGSAISINDTDLNTITFNGNTISDTHYWHYYLSDGYPTMVGLTYNAGGYFEINNEYDLISFSKLLGYATSYNGLTYDRHTYQLMTNIDMGNITSYKTPSKEFKGILYGGTSEFSTTPATNTNKYIYNLTINKPYIYSTNYYMGFLSTVSGTVKNINFYNNTIQLTDTGANYGKSFFVGMVAGDLLSTGVLRNIVSSTYIDLNTEALGRTYAGGIVGRASGSVTYVANKGNIDGNLHDFSNYTINGNFSIGGIVGATGSSQLTLNHAFNEGNITGVGTQASTLFQTSVGSSVNVRVGGIIGEVVNLNQTGNSILYVSNSGNISGGAFQGTSASLVKQYASGIFGELSGYHNELFLSGTTTFKNGRWENLGNILGAYQNIYTTLYASGIGTISTTGSSVEYSYMTNSGSFSIDNLNMATHNRYIYYSSTIINNTSSNLTLSRAYNYGAYTFSNTYFANPAGLSMTGVTINIAPFYKSINNYSTTFKYVVNAGSLTVGSTSVSSTVPVRIYIAGITLNDKVDYYHVTNKSTIKVLNLNQSEEVYVAGISYILPYNETSNTPRYAVDTANKGNITVAGLTGNTTYTSTSTPNSTLVSHNIFVAGLFNINVGEMTNVINTGNITSDDGVMPDIRGTANTYVGGIVTFNYNLMQDVANMGNISFTNRSTTSTVSVAGTTDLFGGMLFAYAGGVTLGGVVAAFGDDSALDIESYGKGYGMIAKLLDSSNNGNVFGKALNYVRTGGILAIALGTEITAGTANASSTAGERRFAYNQTGAGDKVANSELSNGLNFGDVTAVTNTRAAYTGTDQRLGIYASAGGIIAYGLIKLRRMLNHGYIASTDVAGGIIGATFIFGTSSSTGAMPVTYVDIDTAVHYGRVKAVKLTSYSSFTYSNINDYSNTTYFYPDNDTFIFPSTTTNTNLGTKPGYGGIFGRLQRGTYGVMQSTTFRNILNMDPYIDMVGRADQTSTGSFFFYRFGQNGVTDTFYSKRTNDTSPAVIVGFQEPVRTYHFTSVSNMRVYIRREIINGEYLYKVVRLYSGTVSGYYTNDTAQIIGEYLPLSNFAYADIQYEHLIRVLSYGTSNTNFTSIPTTLSSSSYTIRMDPSDFGITPAQLTTLFSGITSASYTTYLAISTPFTITARYTTSYSDYSFEKVSDYSNDAGKTYIFGSTFPLMDPAQTNYIYQAANDVLADGFRLSASDPNYAYFGGMYVLASTKGRQAGAVLPANVKIDQFYELNESGYQYIDVDSPSTANLITTGTEVDTLLASYKAMFQVRYSDKSLVLPQTTYTTLADITLYDPNNLSPILQGGTINNTTKTITFNVTNTAFSQNNVYYEVKSATLSENAVIAISGITEATHPAFKTAYEARTSNILTGTYKPTFSGTIATGGQLSFQMTVYSEIAAEVSALVGTYKTVYTIIINRLSTEIAISFNSLIMDGVSVTPPGLTGTTYIIPSTTRMLNANGTLQAVFLNNNTQLPQGHTFTWQGLYMGSTLVDPAYYTYSLQAKNSSNLLGFTVTLSDLLQSGTYQARLSIYGNTTIYGFEFTKAPSTAHSITNVGYGTFSVDNNATNFTFTPTSSNFTTYIEFGYILEGIPYQTAQSLTVQEVVMDDAPIYLNDGIYYELSYNSVSLLTVSISPFSHLTQATANYTYNANGLKQYNVVYSVMSEAGVTYTINHTILERTLSSPIVYKDGNQQFSTTINVERENLLTTLLIDFNFSDGALNGDITTSIIKNSNPYVIIGDEIVFSYDTFYEIDMSYLLETGLKTFTFTLAREYGYTYSLGSLNIYKQLGVNAYLQDINFQLDSEVTIFYPTLYETTSAGVIVDPSSYDIRAYYEGIDYDGSDQAGLKYYRIDGLVSDIDITNYAPEFYLPFGATIERYDDISASWSTNLITNFISEIENEDKVILYRVVSEDGSDTVYYHVTATDLNYNLTIRFTLYYRFSNGSIVPASDSTSPIKDSVILITIRNYVLLSEIGGVTVNYDVVTNPTTGDITYPYEGNILNYAAYESGQVSINSQATLFYFPLPAGITNYLYTFGRNKTGAYGFSVVTPKYEGTSQAGLTNGLRYTYDIYLSTGSTGGTTYPWNSTNYQLPLIDSTGETVGKYYYIPGSLRQMIREFAIVINESTTGNQWGLYDDYTSWGD